MKTIIRPTLTPFETPLQPTLLSIYELPQFSKEGVIISILYILFLSHSVFLYLSICLSLSAHTQQQKKELSFNPTLSLLPTEQLYHRIIMWHLQQLLFGTYLCVCMHVHCAVTSVETRAGLQHQINRYYARRISYTKSNLRQINK